MKIKTFDLTDERPEPAPAPASPRKPRGKGPRRARPKNQLDGWILLDKPQGLTSTQALGAVKRLFSPAKAGHAGTLDPLATGMLPLALGDATKTVPYVVDGEKSYRFTVQFGAATDSDDTDGTVIARSDVRPTRQAIEAALPAFIGEISQVPPRFSAVKIDGQRAYDLARDGAEVTLKARTVSVRRLEIVGEVTDDTVTLEADCGKGTYVRSIARDLAQALGTVGHVTALRRSRVGPFGEADMRTLETLQAMAADDVQSAISTVLRPPSDGLVELPEVAVDRNEAGRLRRGEAFIVRPGDPLLDGEFRAVQGRQMVALCRHEEGQCQPVRVFRAPRQQITVDTSLERAPAAESQSAAPSV